MLGHLLSNSLGASLLVLAAKSLSLQKAEQRQQASQAGATPAHRPPQRHRSASPAIAARQQLVGGIFIVVSQLLALSTKSGLQPHEAVDAVLCLVLVSVLLIVLPAAAPRLFERYRYVAACVARIALFAQPVVRNPRGMLQVFQGQPSDRAGGLARDLWQLLLGSRSLAMFLTPLACPVPTLPHLALAIFALHRCHMAEFTCSCPKLQHPIWRRRIALLHRLVDKLPLLAPDELSADCLPVTQEVEVEQCRVFVTFIQLLAGVVLPTIIVAQLHAPMHAAAAQRTAQHELRRRRREAARPPDSDSEDAQGGSARACGKWTTLLACRSAAGWAWGGAGALAQHLGEVLGGGGSSWVVNLSAWWLTLSLSWVLAQQPSPEAAAAAGL